MGLTELRYRNEAKSAMTALGLSSNYLGFRPCIVKGDFHTGPRYRECRLPDVHEVLSLFFASLTRIHHGFIDSQKSPEM